MVGNKMPVHGEPTAAQVGQSPSLSAAQRKDRQSDLLDEALLETFPASDPISVVRVK